MSILDDVARCDEFVLSRIYQPIANLAGRWCGATIGGLARGCIAPMIVFASLEVADYCAAHGFSGVLSFLEALFIILMVPPMWFVSHQAERWPNANFLTCRVARMIWAASVIISVPGVVAQIIDGPIASITGSTLNELKQIAIASCFYFASLPPAPPKKQRAGRSDLALAETRG